MRRTKSLVPRSARRPQRDLHDLPGARRAKARRSQGIGRVAEQGLLAPRVQTHMSPLRRARRRPVRVLVLKVRPLRPRLRWLGPVLLAVRLLRLRRLRLLQLLVLLQGHDQSTN